MSLFKMSFYGGVMILVIIILRRIFKNRLPKRTFVILWGVVLLRLLVPFSVPSGFSVYSVVGWQENAGIDNAFYYNTGEDGPTTIFNAGAVDTQMLFPMSGDSEGDMHDSMDEGEINVITFVHAVQYSGTAVCILVFLTLYLCCLHMFHSALPVHNEYIRQWEREHQLIRPISVRQSERISTPLTYGIFKPVILLPKELEWEGGGKLEYILQHEYCHIRKFDAAWKLLMAVALCVHWFNPLVWIMYFLMCRDIELACDEEVLRHLGRDARKNYALTLIGMEEKNSRFTAIYNGFGKTAIEERIRSIMKYKRATLFTIVSAAVIIIMVVCVFATSGKGEQRVNDPVVVGDDGASADDAVPAESGSIPLDPPKEKQDNADEEYTLVSYTLEGMEEKKAASLYVGEGYSLYVTDGDWVMFAPDSWYAEINERVRFWISSYAGLNRGQVERILTEQGYQAEEWGLWKLEDDTMYKISCLETENDVWTLNSVYPSEAEEGWGEILRAMFDTFEVTEGYDVGSTIPKAVMPEGEHLQLFEATYVDETSRAWDLQEPDYTGDYIYNELTISNITETTFDFTITRRNYETDESEIVISRSTASINEDGVSATFEGEDYTLVFDFSDNANPLPVVLTIKLWGMESLEGIRFSNSDIPGYEAG